MIALEPVLSDPQHAVLDAVGLDRAWCLSPLLEQTGARHATVKSLTKLGLIQVREAGGRDPLVYLTDSGRALWGALQDDDHLDDGRPAVHLPGKENHMSATATEEAPAVEDVTGKPNQADPKKPSLTPLFDELLSSVKKAAGRGHETVKKQGYTRVSQNGEAVAYVHNPSSKSVRVEVKRSEGAGYDNVHVRDSGHTDEAMKLVNARVELLAARKKAKAAKAPKATTAAEPKA